MILELLAVILVLAVTWPLLASLLTVFGLVASAAAKDSQSRQRTGQRLGRAYSTHPRRQDIRTRRQSRSQDDDRVPRAEGLRRRRPDRDDDEV